MKKYYSIIVILGMVGCSNVLDVQPKGQIPLSGLFVDEKSAVSATIGAYQPLLFLYNGISSNLFYVVSLADDDGWTWNVNEQPDLFTLDPNDTRLQMWNTLYSGVTRCNTIIARAANAVYTNNGVKNALIGQAHFLRAYYYFNLVRIFGRVPLIIEEVISRADSEKPRASINEVYTLIKNDLGQAKTLLPDNYNTGPGGLAPGLATKFSALALSAMVHLELEEWADAAADASLVLSNSQYKLMGNYADNFNGKAENGAESLFEVQFSNNAATTSVISGQLAPYMYNGGSSSFRFPLPTDLNYSNYPGYKTVGRSGAFGNGIIQDFESGDLRFNVNVSSYNIPNFLDPTQPVGSLYYIHKYLNLADPLFQSSYNYPLIRLAEIYLVRAEALNEMGANNAIAKSDIEKIRSRAGLLGLSASVYADQNLFREAIRKERRTELAFENKRYFDLNRWGILRSKLAIQKVTVPQARTVTHPFTKKEFFLFPIPSPELINNPQLQGDQNQGY